MPDALRTAVERTLDAAGRSARAGTSAIGGRPAELLDDLARRGRDAGGELSRRGGQARDDVARRLELIERRLGSLEELLRGESKGKP